MPSPPRMCAETPSYTLVMWCGAWRPSWPVIRDPRIHHCYRNILIRIEAFLYGTSYIRGSKIFMTSVSWMLMPPPTSRGPRRSASRWQRRKINGGMWRTNCRKIPFIIFFLCWIPPGVGGWYHPQVGCDSPSSKVAATLPEDVRIRQESGCHHNVTGK